jgi:hypothetical protein
LDVFSRSYGAKELTAPVSELRVEYKPRCKKVKKCYTFRENIECLQREKADWKGFATAIRKLSKEEYSNHVKDCGSKVEKEP